MNMRTMKTMTTMATMMLLAAGLTVATACTSEDPYSDYEYTPGSGSTDNTVSGGSTASSTVALADFGIDKTTAEPANTATATWPDETEDNISNEDFSEATTVNIVFSTGGVSCDAPSTMAVTTNGAHLTIDHGSDAKVVYNVSGSTSNGSLTIAGEKKYLLNLNGVSITNPDSTAINLLSKKRAYIVLAGTSTLTDGSESKDSEQKAAFYAKGKMLFSGSGQLNVYGNTKNGIASADYIVFSTGNNIYVKATQNNGIKANDGIYINGGIINVEVSAEAAKGINCEGDIVVNGGRTTCITTGNGTYDSDDAEVKGSAGIKADGNMTVNGGELYMKSSGSAGKGVSVDGTLSVTGGNIYVITTGGTTVYSGGKVTKGYTGSTDRISSSYKSSPKGIKVDGDISIGGGNTLVSASSEGIETKGTMTVTGGHVYAYASDDAINSSSHLTIEGGYVCAYSKGNDGIDANGNCYVKGGTVYAISAGSPEVGIDANTEQNYKLYVTGGTLVAIGGLERGASITQTCYQVSNSSNNNEGGNNGGHGGGPGGGGPGGGPGGNQQTTWDANTWYALYNNGQLALAFLTPQSGGASLIVSTSGTPTMKKNVNVTGGTDLFNGMANIGGTVSYDETNSNTQVNLSQYSSGGGWW